MRNRLYLNAASHAVPDGYDTLLGSTFSIIGSVSDRQRKGKGKVPISLTYPLHSGFVDFAYDRTAARVTAQAFETEKAEQFREIFTPLYPFILYGIFLLKEIASDVQTLSIVASPRYEAQQSSTLEKLPPCQRTTDPSQRLLSTGKQRLHDEFRISPVCGCFEETYFLGTISASFLPIILCPFCKLHDR